MSQNEKHERAQEMLGKVQEATKAAGITRGEDEKLQLDGKHVTEPQVGTFAKELADALKMIASQTRSPEEPQAPPEWGRVTGRTVMLKPGDYVGYFPTKGGKGKFRGGWFKVDADTPVSPECNNVAIVKVGCTYDEGQGVLYHDLKFKVIRYYKDRALALVMPTGSEIEAVARSRDFEGV